MTTDQGQRLAELHERLAAEVASLRSGEDWTRWLDAARRFHRYSFNNVLLILAQRPEATRVAGYQTWKSLGRQVNRGEKGLQVLAPIIRRARTDHDSGGARDPGDADSAANDDGDDADRGRSNPSAGADSAKRMVGCRVSHVWDVAQTSGDPLPERPTPILLAGQAPAGLWDGLAEQVTGRGFGLLRGECGGANGRTDFAARTVTVRGDVDEAQAVKTLAHELGHIVLHDPADFARAGTGGCRGVAEVEAESFAYLLAGACGLATGDYSFGYVAAWASRVDEDRVEEVVAATGQRVLAAAAPLLDRLTPATVEPSQTTQTAAAQAAPGLRQQAATVGLDASQAEGLPHVDGQRRPERERLLAAQQAAAGFYTAQLQADGGAGARAYLTGRGLGHLLDEAEVDADARWRVGYAPAGWRTLTEHLGAAGFTDEELLAAGLAQRSRRGSLIDRFRDRVMLGVHDGGGDLVGFIGRAAPGADGEVPKYLNSPSTALFDKGSVLFGLAEQHDRWAAGAAPVLVEGPLDVLALDPFTSNPANRVGDEKWAAVAPCGTALTAAQATALSEHTTGGVVVAFDGDQAGSAAAARAYPVLASPLDQQRALRVAALPAGADPADLVVAPGGPERLRSALGATGPLADLVVNVGLAGWRSRLDNAEARICALRETARAVVGLRPDDVGRQAARLATALGVDAGTVTHELIVAATARLGDLDRWAPASSVRHRRSSLAVPPRQLADTPPPPPRPIENPARVAGPTRSVPVWGALR